MNVIYELNRKMSYIELVLKKKQSEINVLEDVIRDKEGEIDFLRKEINDLRYDGTELKDKLRYFEEE